MKHLYLQFLATQFKCEPFICMFSDDIDGARHLPTLSTSSESTISHGGKTGLNMAGFCLDKKALAVQNTQYCNTLEEPFPWIMLEYQEEVLHLIHY